MRLDELIERFLELSHRIAEAIISDENIEHIRRVDEQLSDVFDAILNYEAKDESDNVMKRHFLIDQIVVSEDLSRRRQLADQLKELSTSSKF